jgi:hypothetical protein
MIQLIKDVNNVKVEDTQLNIIQSNVILVIK